MDGKWVWCMFVKGARVFAEWKYAVGFSDEANCWCAGKEIW